ncbi:RNA polymerase sigma factor [Sorangium cellulosum]|uniref:RNA polymerase sigma factor n=1 Tax=Sorangium cellulosum TaxID=56 RepID=UPI001F328368|nr:sigma-70 family RNA polymerase sigma factor [Sorangium cellulosum]
MKPTSPQPAPGRNVVSLLPQSERSDGELVHAIAAGEPWAAAMLLDRYGPLVERLIRRVMGHDPELEDLVHDAFATILTSIHQVRDGQAVKGWISSVAVHTAHRAIRRRRLSRWLFFWQHDEELPEPSSVPAHGPREALRRVYAALDELSAEDRIAFTLRFVEEMPLEDVASACGVSLATVKRRLARAEQRFTALAKRDPVLRGWMEEGDRWTTNQ